VGEGKSSNSAGASLAVIVPTLEEARRLPGLLRALAPGHGSDAPDEIVVSDGGSRDETAEVATGLGARVVTGSAGRGVQLARGADAVEADLLLFLHADARLRSGSIAAVRSAFLDPELVAVGMRQRIDHEGGLYRWIERAADARVRFGWIYGDSGLAVRRDAYRAVGGFRPLPIFEDLDLSRRLRRRGRLRLVREAEISVSPRRWERDGALWCTFRNWCLTVAWAAGVSPSRLVRFYPPHQGARDAP